MFESNSPALELFRLIEMNLDFRPERLEFLRSAARSYLNAADNTLEARENAKFLVEALFRFGELSLSAQVAQRRIVDGADLSAFDQLAINYHALSQMVLQTTELLTHRALYSRPERRPHERIRVLSFLFTSPSYQNNGYAVRSQAILEHTKLEVLPFTKIGFPWTANLLRDARHMISSRFGDIEYFHRRGGMRNQNDTLAYLGLAKFEIKKIIAELRPDIVHAASNFTVGLPALLAARECRLPFVYEMRGIWELTQGVGVLGWTERERYRSERRLETFIAKAADRVITLTETQKQELVARDVAADHIHVVPNYYSKENSSADPNAPFISQLRASLPPGPVIGYAGSIVNYEGLQDLVAVLARDNPALKSATLLVLGDGPYLAQLKLEVQRHGLTRRVIFTGRVPKVDAEAAYALFDLCVLPRLPDDVAKLVSPLKLIEILAKGNVLLVSDVGAMLERVEAIGFGEIFRAGDLDDLEAQLIRIIGDLPALKQRYAAAAPLILEHHVWSKGVDAWDATLRGAVAAWEKRAASEPHRDLAQDTTATLVPAHQEEQSTPCISLLRLARGRLPASLRGTLRLSAPIPALAKLFAVLIDPATAAGTTLTFTVRPDIGAPPSAEAVLSDGPDRVLHLYLTPALAAEHHVDSWHLDLVDGEKIVPIRLVREADAILAIRAHQLPRREEYLEFISRHAEPVRFAQSVIPLNGAATEAAFERLHYSDAIGAKFQYVRVEPGHGRQPLKTGIIGHSLVEMTPWQDGYRRGANQLMISRISWMSSRPASHYLRLKKDRHNVLVVANLNENLIDGSAIWLKTLVSALAASEHVHVFVITNAVLLPNNINASLFSRANVVKLDFATNALLPHAPPVDAALAEQVEIYDRTSGGFDSIIVRGSSIARRINGKAMRGRLIVYSVGMIAPENICGSICTDTAAIDILRRSRGIIFQNPETAEIFANSAPDYQGKCLVIPPSVDAEEFAEAERLDAAMPRSPGRMIVYAGKIIRHYGLLELLDIVTALRQNPEFSDVRLVIIGNKFDSHDAEFNNRFRARMEALGASVHWIASAPPAEVLMHVRRARVVWGWRHAQFETSHMEVSTKMVEALSLGSTIVLCPTRATKKLLGRSYRGFAATPEAAASVVETLLRDKTKRNEKYRETYASRTTYAALLESLTIPMRGDGILVASHDFKFFDDIEGLLLRDGHPVYRETWKSHTDRDPHGELQALDDIEMIFCEWCMGNAVYWSNNLPAGKRLIIRLHLQEIYTDFPRRVNWANVEKIVFVSPYIMREARQNFAIPAEKCCVVPIQVNFSANCRFTAAEYASRRDVLALVGLTPWRKRIDRSIELLKRLRQRHPNLRMLVKGKMPSEYSWMKSRPDELALYKTAFQELIELKNQGGVEFCGFDDNMEEFYRRAGWVLSMSDFEGCHTAVAEGGVMGCLPLMGFWGGAGEVYPAKYAHSDMDDIERFFEENYPRFGVESRAIQKRFAKEFLLDEVYRHWRGLFDGTGQQTA